MPEQETATEETGTTETQSTEQVADQHNEAIPGDDDGWGSSKEAFFDGSGYEDGDSFDIVADDPLAELEGEDGSNLEAKETKKEPETEQVVDGALNLKFDYEGLAIPEKFKGRVKEQVDALLASANEQNAKAVEGFKGSSEALSGAFQEILLSENPMATFKKYAEDAVKAYNLPPEVLSKLGGAEPANDVKIDHGPIDFDAVNQKVGQAINQIRSKYDQAINNSEDNNQILALMNEKAEKISQIKDAVRDAKLKETLKAYHNQLVQPRFDEYGNLKKESDEQKTQAQMTQQGSHWNNADSELKAELPDWSKYRNAVKGMIKGDGKYGFARKQANETGQGHKDLLKDLYYIVSRKDHLEAAKKPTQGRGGLKPDGKHIKTNKVGGSDWDDIEETYWR